MTMLHIYVVEEPDRHDAREIVELLGLPLDPDGEYLGVERELETLAVVFPPTTWVGEQPGLIGEVTPAQLDEFLEDLQVSGADTHALGEVSRRMKEVLSNDSDSVFRIRLV